MLSPPTINLLNLLTPVKVIFTDKDPMGNADMSKEYWYAQRFRSGNFTVSRMGIYDLT